MSQAPQPPVAGTKTDRPSLGAWSLYFIAKFVLLWKGLIGFHPLENLAFAAFLLVPPRSPGWRRARNVVAVPIAIALLYRDSWLPPLGRVLSQASLVSNFSAAYLVELTGRFISWPVIALLVIAWALYHLVARRVRVGAVVLVALLVLAFKPEATGTVAAETQPPPSSAPTPGATATADVGSPDAALQAFYAREAERSVTFPPVDPQGKPFDLVFIHVCSLSWDDLRAVGLENHPLWQRFDFLFTRFNAASSYSGPAAIRIHRAPCGQPSHTALYAGAADRCYLMSSLQQSGFTPNLVLNHDGHFDEFLDVVKTRGRLNAAPMPIDGLPVAQRAFDDSPIYGDLAVLSRWLDQRAGGPARVAAYYNTVSLHDGNRLSGAPRGNSLDTYKVRLTRLLDDLDRFMQKIESSGRRAVVVVVPEHGAAVRGDAMQIAGLREIPTPAITLVPVGMKVIGPEVQRTGAPLRIDAPTSFLAVSHLVARLLEHSPFGAGAFAPQEYTAGLPATDFVAENEDVVVMERGNRFFLRQGQEGWMDYPTSGAQ